MIKYLILFIFLFCCCSEWQAKECQFKGIDISHHQNRVDWEKVKTNGNISFIYIKITEGKDLIDTFSRSYFENSKKQNIPVGFYHYFTFCSSPQEQAYHFINNIKGHEYNLTPAVDVEYAGNCSTIPNKTELKNNVAVFSKIIKDSLGIDPIIYTTQRFYNDFFKNFTGLKFWIRNVLFKPSNKINWVIWQYKVGKLEGINTEVDFDAFRGDSVEFTQYKIMNKG